MNINPAQLNELAIQRKAKFLHEFKWPQIRNF